MPALARQKSTAGAQTFVTFYVDVLDSRGSRSLETASGHLGSRPAGVCKQIGELCRSDDVSRRRTNGRPMDRQIDGCDPGAVY